MESLKLNIPALVSEHVHDKLEVGLVSDVSGHDIEVCPI